MKAPFKKPSQISFRIKPFPINYLNGMLQLFSIRCQYKYHPGNIENMFDGFQHFYCIRGTTAIKFINQDKCGDLFLFLANNRLYPLLYFMLEQLYRFCLFTRVLKE